MVNYKPLYAPTTTCVPIWYCLYPFSQAACLSAGGAGFQLVQKRVTPDTDCEHSSRFGDWAGDCFSGEYNSQVRQEHPFGPVHDPEKYQFT